LKTIVLDNNLENIKIYDACKIDRIFIDLEIHGKQERQGHLDTVISDHTFEDIKRIKPLLKNSQVLVRVNPIYKDSLKEINTVIDNGADIVMLPMFKTKDEVESFISYVNKRATVCLLLETSEALCRIDDILELDGIDEIHIGLNDLHLALGLDFMFELMGGGIIEYLTKKIAIKNIPFGIGGVARMDDGMLQGKIVIREHIRLGSSMVILSRTFKGENTLKQPFLEKELLKLKNEVEIAKNLSIEKLNENQYDLHSTAQKIANIIKKNRINRS